MSDHWLEIRSPSYRITAAIYAEATALGAKSMHHFSEPWYQDGFVIRVMASKARLEKIRTRAEELGADPRDWNAVPDEILFGDDWPAVRDFFAAASRVALIRNKWEPKTSKFGHQWLDAKLIHCALNSWGYVTTDEVAFAKRVVKERKAMLKAER